MSQNDHSEASSSPFSKAQDETLDRAHSALIFIEFQNEWLDESSPLNQRIEDRQYYADAVRNAETLIKAARQSGFPIVHAGLSFVNDPTYLLFGGGKGKAGLRGAIPKAGRWRDPQLAAFHEPFVPQEGEFVVSGRSGASVLMNSTLDAYLRNNRIDHLFLLGFVLHVCVESTLRHAHDLGYDVTVIGDAAPAFTTAQRDHVLNHVVPHFGRQMPTERFLEKIRAP